VVIEDRQQKTLDHVRSSAGYADDVSPHAHDRATFRLINQRKELDGLPGADYVVPKLDHWKFWTKMKDWDSRNRLLEELTGKLRRREATAAEIQLLVVICKPTWAAVTQSLRRYGGADLDPRAQGKHQREEAARINELDRAELDQVIQHALLDALRATPRPFPRFFFSWLKDVLAHRALDHVRCDLGEHGTQLPHDTEIKDVVDRALSDARVRSAAFFAAPASPGHSAWLRTLDLPAIFSLAEEYASYARTQTACQRAVERLPDRQRLVVESRYYGEMNQRQIADAHGLAASSVRSTHAGALRNLRRDDALFEVLEAVGKVRDRDRRLELERDRSVRLAA
jgi:RNA polymerase sigma factor (sigma-70 family)